MNDTEYLEEFGDYLSADYRDNYSLAEVYGAFGNSETNRGFKWVGNKRTVTEYSKERYEKIELFSKTLIEFGNLEYARKVSGIGYYTAWYYINFLNKAAEDRGLPIIFQKKTNYRRPNVKLNEKQVSYIKFLITKYSSYKVAKMYNISQSTIHLIKRGMIWKNVVSVLNKEQGVQVSDTTKADM